VNDGITPLCSHHNGFSITNIRENFMSILVPFESRRPALQTHHVISTTNEFTSDTTKKQTASTSN
jgi:hypothetical protein